MKNKIISHRISAVTITFMMLGIMFVGMLNFTQDVAASKTIVIETDAALDGYIYMNGTSWPPVDTGPTVNSTSTQITTGSIYSPGTSMYYLYRGFLSFDTSVIPTGAVILSATVEATVIAYGGSTPISYLYSADYGAALDVADWGTVGSFEGTFWSNSYPFSWQASLGVDVRGINIGALTQYVIRDSNEADSATNYVAYASSEHASISPPTLTVTYMILGALISIELDSGSWLNSTAFPDVQDWNLTYDLHCYEIDTVPGSKNITIAKDDANWTMAGMSPSCNYTETDTELLLWDVYDSICYRVWFHVPKVNPYTSVHLSLYNSFTGEGFYWEQMKVMICDGLTWDNTTSETISRPDFDVEPNQNYTLRVFDYFDNMLADQPFVANAQDVYLSIPVPYYSWQIFNMNEMPVLVKIYWNNSGAPWEFFVGPQWIIERNLKGGNYTFMVTFYEADGTAGSTVSYVRTVPYPGLNASFIYVSGTNLSEIISDIEGVMAVQQIITNLISPSTILIYENLPMAPVQIRSLSLQDSITIDPYLILEATTYQNATVTRYIDTTLEQTHPSVIGATYYVLSDILSFSGTYATELYINDTGGANLYHSTVLPATVQLDGEEVTIWSNTNLSVSRASTWREITEYAVNYYITQHKWETNVVLNNSYTLDYHTPYWYIAFPEDATINQETVTLYDLDNSVYLSQRTNFDVTAGGVHVTLTQLNTSSARSFRLTFWDYNSTVGIGAPNLIAEAYTQSTLNGVPMKYTAVQWFNTYSVEYRGEVYITLNFTYGDYLLKSSIKIIDETTGNLISSNQWIYTGRTIIILTDGVGTVPVGGARNYGIYFTLDYESASEDREDFFFGPIVVNGKQFYIGTYAVSYFIILLLVVWAITIMLWFKSRKGFETMLVMSSAITIIGVYLSGYM